MGGKPQILSKYGIYYLVLSLYFCFFSSSCYTRLSVVITKCNWEEIPQSIFGHARKDHYGALKLRIIAGDPGCAGLIIRNCERTCEPERKFSAHHYPLVRREPGNMQAAQLSVVEIMGA